MSSIKNVEVDKTGRIKTSNDEFIELYAKSLNEMRVRLLSIDTKGDERMFLETICAIDEMLKQYIEKRIENG